MSRMRPFLILAVLACAALAVAGCGSSKSSGSGSSSSSLTTSSSSESQSSASSGAKLNVKPKTIGVVLSDGEAPISQANTKTVEAACKLLGWKVSVTETSGVPANMLRATYAYATEKVDAVLFDSVEEGQVRPGLLRLKAEGIPAIEYSAGNEPGANFSAEYGETEKQIGVSMAKQLVKLVPNARIAELKSTFHAGKEREAGLKEVVNGPEGNGAKIVAGEEPNLASVVPETVKDVQDMITAHPEINAIFSVFDNFTAPVVTALKAKGSKAKVFTPYIATAELNFLKEGKLAGIISVDNPTSAAVAIDQLLAHFQKGTPINKEALKEHPLTYTEYSQANIPASAEAVLGPEVILKPFIEKWDKEYGS